MSSSIVSIRALVSGPVSVQTCLPTLPKRGSTVSSSLSEALQSITPRGPNLARNAGLFRVVRQFRLFLGVEVIEVAVELVEAVYGGQELVAVAQVVLAELPGRIAERLEQFRNRRVFLLQAERGARQADLGQAGAQAGLAGDEGGPTGRAALLGIVVGEHHAFLRDAVDVGRLVAHQAVRIGADVGLPDVVTPDDDDVRLGCLCRSPTEHRDAVTIAHGKPQASGEQHIFRESSWLLQFRHLSAPSVA